MSQFTVNLNEPQPEQETIVSQNQNADDSVAAGQPPKKRSGFLKWLGISLLIFIVLFVVGGFLYWQTVKKTPAYSLALIVDAARRDDKQQLEQLVDTEAVVNDFMPQIIAKAVELYGRGLPPQALARAEQAAQPFLPAVKDRARSELPRVIREKTAPVENVPYWLIALGANRAVDIKIDGDTAQVTSKIPDRPLELTMRRDGDRWKIVAFKDDVLAQKIAEKIGQDIIAFAAKNGVKKTGEQFGVKNADELLKNMQDIFK